jgi:hypothetical protein
MTAGRPPKWASPAELQADIDAYFATVDGLPTVSGLCLALDCCRETLWDYSRKPEFSDAIKKARTRLELAWEKRLGENSCTGAIFWLKNQGWKDTQDLNHTGQIDSHLTVAFKD